MPLPLLLRNVTKENIEETIQSERSEHSESHERSERSKPFSAPVQYFKYFLVIDFEATCLKEEDIKPQEIIEFPCLKIDAKTFEVENSFHYYVRPIHHPELSEFCIEKTGIEQERINHAPEFTEVIKLFELWMEQEGLMMPNFAFVTCGNWDFNVFLRNQCKTSNIPYPEWAKQWINLKAAYKKARKCLPKNMSEMLKDLNLSVVGKGRLHSGVDDTLKIATIIKELASRGSIFNVNSFKRDLDDY